MGLPCQPSLIPPQWHGIAEPLLLYGALLAFTLASAAVKGCAGARRVAKETARKREEDAGIELLGDIAPLGSNLRKGSGSAAGSSRSLQAAAAGGSGSRETKQMPVNGAAGDSKGALSPVVVQQNPMLAAMASRRHSLMPTARQPSAAFANTGARRHTLAPLSMAASTAAWHSSDGWASPGQVNVSSGGAAVEAEGKQAAQQRSGGGGLQGGSKAATAASAPSKRRHDAVIEVGSCASNLEQCLHAWAATSVVPLLAAVVQSTVCVPLTQVAAPDVGTLPLEFVQGAVVHLSSLTAVCSASAAAVALAPSLGFAVIGATPASFAVGGSLVAVLVVYLASHYVRSCVWARRSLRGGVQAGAGTTPTGKEALEEEDEGEGGLHEAGGTGAWTDGFKLEGIASQARPHPYPLLAVGLPRALVLAGPVALKQLPKDRRCGVSLLHGTWCTPAIDLLLRFAALLPLCVAPQYPVMVSSCNSPRSPFHRLMAAYLPCLFCQHIIGVLGFGLFPFYIAWLPPSPLRKLQQHYTFSAVVWTKAPLLPCLFMILMFDLCILPTGLGSVLSVPLCFAHCAAGLVWRAIPGHCCCCCCYDGCLYPSGIAGESLCALLHARWEGVGHSLGIMVVITCQAAAFCCD